MDDDSAVTTAKHRVIGRPIVPGQRLNPHGRPKGSRHRLAEQFVKDLYTVWQERGIEAIRRMAAIQPGRFVQVVASVLPKDIEVERQDTVIIVPAEATDVAQWLIDVTPPAAELTRDGDDHH
jgi:hypothetical protein